jgi:hypothetical protein
MQAPPEPTCQDAAVSDVLILGCQLLGTHVPENRGNPVNGSYELPAPKGKTRVAVKIIDMVGEEVVEVRGSGF